VQIKLRNLHPRGRNTTDNPRQFFASVVQKNLQRSKIDMLATDTETTGLSTRHGCMPFFISCCTDKGKVHYWEWNVNPLTRKVRYREKDVKEFLVLAAKHSYIPGVSKKYHNIPRPGFVYHNTKFDIRMLSVIGKQSYFNQNLKKMLAKAMPKDMAPWFGEDTLVASHVLNSGEYHGLKYLCKTYLEISEVDEQELQVACNSARRIGRKLGWNISEKEHPNLPGQRGKFWASDMWLPRAVCVHAPDSLPNMRGWGHGDTPKDHPWYTVLETYALTDAERTMALWKLQKIALRERDIYFKEFDPRTDETKGKNWLYTHYLEQLSLLPITYQMESNGVNLRDDVLQAEVTKYTAKAEYHDHECKNLIPKSYAKYTPLNSFNLSSNKQLQKLLYSEKGFNFPVETTTKSGQPSTAQAVLIELRTVAQNKSSKINNPSQAFKFLTSLLIKKKFEKSAVYLQSYNTFSIKKTMTKTAKRTLYPSFNQTGTRTTRYSSSNPNAQNIGKPEDGSQYKDNAPDLMEIYQRAGINLRSVFGPAKGRVWYAIDYAQLQLRIFAYVSGETNLINAFDSGWDAHDYMAHRIFHLSEDTPPTKIQRRIAKAVNFGFIFGAGPRKIEATAGKPGLWDEVTTMFPNAHKFIQATTKSVRRHGFINTTSGYPLMVDQRMPYAGVNYIVQGDEGIIVKRAMRACYDYLKQMSVGLDAGGKMIMQVHDELIFEFFTERRLARIEPDAQAGRVESTIIPKICSLMEGAGTSIGMHTPVDCERITTSWAEGEKV